MALTGETRWVGRGFEARLRTGLRFAWSMRRLPLLLTVGWLMLGGHLIAQNQPPPPPPESRDFDFWVGDWEVSTPDGKVVGFNRIEPILGGRVLRESYTTKGAFAGHSFNSFNAPAARWEQFWVDNSGTVLHLKGGLNQAGEMVLSGERTTTDGTVIDRITWTPNEDASVRQHWELSADDGETWQTLFDGTYRLRSDKK